MKTKDKPNKSENDKIKQGHENQNIYDFNPSQFVEEDDIDKRKKEKTKGQIGVYLLTDYLIWSSIIR